MPDPIIGADGIIYGRAFYSDSNKFYAIRPEGSIQWEYNIVMLQMEKEAF